MSVPSSNERPIAVDLFAGAGGMTLGFEQAGFDVLASVEIDPIHCLIHQFNFPFWSILCQNITTITGEDIRINSNLKNREIDVVFGGPPCQGFSLMGKRLIDDPRNSLLFHFIRLVFELQPKYFVLENVKGMAVGKHQKFITEMIHEFHKINYTLNQNYQILNASDYGVPQNRERLFLIGCRQDLEIPQYPNPITRFIKPTKTLKKNQNPLPLPPTVWDAIQDLPEVENYPELYKKDWVIAPFGKPSDYAKELRGFSFSDNDYSYERHYNSRLLTSSLRTKHTGESIQRFAATSPGKIESISHFYKLDSHGICNTLRAGTPSNRGAFTSPRPIHPITPRCITVREAARLHSYPDWFRFHRTKWHGFRQIGNSVPPLLAKAVALEIMHLLAKSLSKPQIIKPLGNPNFLTYNMSQASYYFKISPQTIEPRKSREKFSQ